MFLLVFVVKIRLGFHVATLFLSIGVQSVLHLSWRVASSVFRCVSIQQWNIECLHVLCRLVCTAFDVLDPVFYVFVCSIAFKGRRRCLSHVRRSCFFPSSDHVDNPLLLSFVVYHTVSLVLMQSGTSFSLVR